MSGCNDEATSVGDERAKHERSDSGQLHQNVDGRSRRVLQRVAHGVTDHGSTVLSGRGAVGVLLSENEGVQLLLLIEGLRRLESSLTNQFLRVIPCSSCVRETESNLNARNDDASKKA